MKQTLYERLEALPEELTGEILNGQIHTQPRSAWRHAGATRGAPHRGGPGLIRDQRGPFANADPYTSQTEGTLRRLAALNPKMLAIMHGSTFVGDGGQAISDLARVLREVLSGDIATE